MCFLLSGMGAAPIHDDKKITVISMEQNRDDKLKSNRCRLVRTSPNRVDFTLSMSCFAFI